MFAVFIPLIIFGGIGLYFLCKDPNNYHTIKPIGPKSWHYNYVKDRSEPVW